jgi:hypothetical protein
MKLICELMRALREFFCCARTNETLKMQYTCKSCFVWAFCNLIIVGCGECTLWFLEKKYINKSSHASFIYILKEMTLIIQMVLKNFRRNVFIVESMENATYRGFIEIFCVNLNWEIENSIKIQQKTPQIWLCLFPYFEFFLLCLLWSLEFHANIAI